MDLNETILKEAAELADIKLVDSRDIPRIDLYMEQVTSFLEQEMGDSLRYKDEGVFTNTMINNYTKAGVLPRPENKRYNRRHILTLIYIYLLKQNLSMPEIKTFTSFIQDTEQLSQMYDVFRDLLADYGDNYLRMMKEKLELIDRKFEACGIDDDAMKAMTFISLISFDATVSTMLSNRLLDICREEREAAAKAAEETAQREKEEEEARKKAEEEQKKRDREAEEQAGKEREEAEKQAKKEQEEAGK